MTRNVVSTISMIIVAGACGIAAGTPQALLGGIGRSARRGAIVKGGRFLETLGRVDMVVLDKTGTLTFGRPEVRAVVELAGTTEAELLDIAASAELRSEHSLGGAIVERVQSELRSWRSSSTQLVCCRPWSVPLRARCRPRRRTRLSPHRNCL